MAELKTTTDKTKRDSDELVISGEKSRFCSIFALGYLRNRSFDFNSIMLKILEIFWIFQKNLNFYDFDQYW